MPYSRRSSRSSTGSGDGRPALGLEPDAADRLSDIVRCLVGVAGRSEAVGQRFDVGGPEVLTYVEMIGRIARLRGRRPLMINVPRLSPRVSSYWLHLVTPVRASVARPLVEALGNPTVARDDRIPRLLPFPLTAFDDAARRAFV